MTGSINGQTVPAINDQYVYDVATVGNFTAQNPIGRLVKQSNGYNASTQFSYDPMGRLLLQTNFLPDSNGADLTVNPISAAYDLAGNLTDLTYPDGRHVHQTFDSAGRLGQPGQNAVADVGTGQPYVQTISYNADSSPQTMTFGNGVAQTVTENSRLQTQSLFVNSPSGSPLSLAAVQPLLSHTYCYAGCNPFAGGTAGTANNGNIWQIADGLKPAKTQDFTYDGLNRIQSFSLGGVLTQQFQIDSFGNMAQTLGGGFVPNFNPLAGQLVTNQVTNLPCASFTPSHTGYDSAGNQQCSMDPSLGTSLYSYDAESRISQINTLNSASPFVSYLYGADGAGVRKSNADGTFTEYVSFGGHVISEMDDAGQWTDYIFAGDRRIARLRAEDQWLFANVANTSTSPLVSWTMPVPSNPGSGGAYVVKAGDRLCVRQLNTNEIIGGPFATFTLNGNSIVTDSTWTASDGAPLGAAVGTYPTNWSNRCVDLSDGGATAGAAISSLGVQSSSATASFPGGYMLFADMAIVSTDGTATPISLSVTGGPQTGGFQALTAYPWMDNNPSLSVESTHYFIADHLGSAQMEIADGGWPIYSGQFAPFGQEIQNGQYLPQTQPDGSTSNYKFTGKERDAESGLDYFGARYMSSNMGRFMSPDYSDGPDPVPFGDLENPESLNLYSYVQNNPINSIDEDGHLDCSGGATQDVACAVTAAAKAVWNFLKGDNSSVTTSQTITVPDPPAPGVPEGAPGTATGGLIQAQNDARSNPRFQPNATTTFCNMASCYIGQHAGSNMGPLMTNGIPNLANTDYNNFAHSGSYHQVGRAEAQRLANMGKVVYGVYKEPGHGHIITVRPNNGPYTGSGSPSTGPDDPIINDIGRHIGVYPLSQQPSAGFRSGVIFYAPN